MTSQASAKSHGRRYVMGWLEMSPRVVAFAVLSGVLAGLASSADAQDRYPSRPIRLVVPFAVGGASDLVSRALGRELGEMLGQSIVIDNRVGATGRIGSEIVARAPADGYTLLLAVTSTHAVLPALSPNVPYDALKDFAAIIKVGESPLTLVATSSLPYSTVSEVIAFAKANPGRVSYASSGIGSILHLAGELFAHAAGVQILHVPYKGDAPALADMAGGNVDVMFTPTPGPALDTKRVKAIGRASLRRSNTMPGVPTFDESGVPGFVVASFIGVMAPAGTPRPVTLRLNEMSNKALALPVLRKRLEELGYEAVGGTPEDFERALANDIRRFRQLNVKLE